MTISRTLHFITGLPRSGSSVISSLLNQNPSIASDTNSVLSHVVQGMNQSWPMSSNISISDMQQIKLQSMRAVLWGYHEHHPQSVIFDRSLSWIPLIPVVEELLGAQIKILVCVRNPAEILASFERSRAQSPLWAADLERTMGGKSSIASRAFFYAGPEGVLGTTHRDVQDSVVMGYLDRMLFVDYGLFCSNPRSQTRRIYDFFDLPYHEHDFRDIPRDNPGVRSVLEKITVNPVQYLGLDLFDQYNSNIFWNAWV